MNIDQWIEGRIADARKTGVLGTRYGFKQQLISEKPEAILRIRQVINKTDWSNPTVGKANGANGEHRVREQASSSRASSGAPSSRSSLYSDASSQSSADLSAPPAKPAQTQMKASKIQNFCNSLVKGSPGKTPENVAPTIPPLNDQKLLLRRSSNGHLTEATSQSLENAVMFSVNAYQENKVGHASQFALLGSYMLEPCIEAPMIDDRVFLNTNIPFSAFVCGLQGSGKSHTASCIIENCMIKSATLGVLQSPASALVLHYGEYSTANSFRPSDFAFLSSIDREMCGDSSANQLSVTVLVSRSNYPNMKVRYADIPGVAVRPFLIQPAELTAGTMLALMAVAKNKSPPLYISQVTNILRQMSSESSEEFCYKEFRQRLDDTHFDKFQREHLSQRLDLLESFIDLSGKSVETGFAPGQVTIIDLSCPFVDENTACLLFNIGMSRFMQSTESRGKLVVLDEAHKFMHDTPGAKQLTAQLLTMIRQQRHYGLRVVIATQEPYVSPLLLDLCSVIIIHHFNSPAWLDFLKNHVATGSQDVKDLFREISELQTGEAIVFAPSAVLNFGGSPSQKVGGRRFRIAVRKRITWDSGRSVLSV